MQEWRITRLRGGFALTFDRDGRRHRYTLNTNDPSEAKRIAPSFYAELNRPKGTTVADNMQDMILRGRHVVRDQSGENNGAAKLKGRDVAEIRQLISNGHTNTAIARKYGVTHSMISRIRRNKSWAA